MGPKSTDIKVTSLSVLGFRGVRFKVLGFGVKSLDIFNTPGFGTIVASWRIVTTSMKSGLKYSIPHNTSRKPAPQPSMENPMLAKFPFKFPCRFHLILHDSRIEAPRL